MTKLPWFKFYPADWDAMKSRDALAIVDKARGGQRAHVPFLMDMPTAAVWP